MKDINFFEAYKESSRQSKGRFGNKPLILIVTIVLAIIVAITLGTIYAKILVMKSEMKKMDEYLSSAEIKTKLAEYKDEKALSDGYDKYISILDNVILQSEQTPSADSRIITEIYDAIPSGGRITAFNISGKSVSISGILSSKNSVPDLIVNLKNIRRLSEVFVESESLQQDASNVAFSAKCTIELEGGDIK